MKVPCFGVKVSDLQKIVNRTNQDYTCALELYDTGNCDECVLPA